MSRIAQSDEAPFATLQRLDPNWGAAFEKVSSNPWTSGVLPVRDIELICVALNAACTNMHAPGTRRHIRAALKAGATSQQIVGVLKTTWGLGVHSCSLAAPILLEEAKEAGLHRAPATHPQETPICDRMRVSGAWNPNWDPFFNLDPVFTEELMGAYVPLYQDGVLSTRLLELVSVALDAYCTHMYAPGTRRHIRAALHAGATIEEVMEVLKLCVAVCAESVTQGVAILVDELADFTTG